MNIDAYEMTPASPPLIDFAICSSGLSTVTSTRYLSRICSGGVDSVEDEDQGSGTSLIQEMRRDGIRPIAINPRGDKLSRVQAATPFLERGEVLLPAEAPWVDDFLAETATFPQGHHDDQIDALAQYLNWLPDGTRPKGGIMRMTGGTRTC